MGNRPTTELDDAVERVLNRYIPDTIWRIQAAREVIALAVQAGAHPHAHVTTPDEPANALGTRTA